MRISAKWVAATVLAVTVATNLMLLTTPPHILRHLAAFILLWALPGLLGSLCLAQRGRLPGGDEIMIGLGLGMAATALLTLLLHYLPGRLTAVHLCAGSDVLIVLQVVFLVQRGGRDLAIRFEQGRNKRSCLLGAALLFLIIALRFVNLGYSEFQGDEGVIMVRAARALEGDDAALFAHQKGPVEILLPMATWRLSGTIDEFWARAPFAYAGALGVLAVALLGRRLFNGRTGWLAGWLIAISGYHVAFGRIVQYQSVVLLATATGLLALWRWTQNDGERWLFVAAALIAFGGLCHYDAVMVLPPAAYLVARRLAGHGSWITNRVSRYLVLAVLVGITLLATFYLPYALSPSFGKTVGYLSGERVGSGGPVYDNLGASFVLTTVYNSTWYVAGLILLVVSASLATFRGFWQLLPLTLIALAWWISASFQSSSVPFAILGLWFVAVFFSRRATHPFRIAWIWFGVPFLFFHFLVWDPRTHVLNLFPGACLIAAWASLQVGEFAGGQVRIVVLLPSVVFLGLASFYPFWMFVDHTPEVQRTWPVHRLAFYPTVYDEIPSFGLFGFPHRAGWKVVGALFDGERLKGSYASNEEVEVTGWYTRGAERTYCPDPDGYIVAEQVQDQIPLDWADLEANYHLAATVEQGERAILRLYTRGSSEPETYLLREFSAVFDAATTPAAVLPVPPRDYAPVEATLGNQVHLLGYRLEGVNVAPGSSVELTLYWEALVPLEKSYHVFTHLYSDGEMWGQADGIPQCGLWPTLRWLPGEVVADRYRLTLRPDTPLGAIPLTVGMYTLPDGARLPVQDVQGRSLGDTVPLATLEVGP